jgi:hypothetical protein
MTETLANLLGSTEQTFFLGSLLYAACYGGDCFLTKILGAALHA